MARSFAMASLFSLTTISRAFSSSIGAGMDVPESVEIVGGSKGCPFCPGYRPLVASSGRGGGSGCCAGGVLLALDIGDFSERLLCSVLYLVDGSLELIHCGLVAHLLQ